MSIIDQTRPIAKPNRKRLRLRIRPRPDAVPTVALPDGRVIPTATPSGVLIDQHPAPRFAPIAPPEPPIVERPEPRPDDLDDALPWYKAPMFVPEWDAVFYGVSAPEPRSRMRASAMRLDHDEDARACGLA